MARASALKEADRAACATVQQARDRAYLLICHAVVPRRMADLLKAGAAADEAAARDSLRPQLQLLQELPTDILVGLAALAPDQALDTVTGLRALTRLERAQSMVRGVPPTSPHAHACRDCPVTHVLGQRKRQASQNSLPGSCHVPVQLHAWTAPSARCAALAHLLAACSVRCSCACTPPGLKH